MSAQDIFSFAPHSPLHYYLVVIMENHMSYVNNRVSLEQVLRDLETVIRTAGLFCRENPAIFIPDFGLSVALGFRVQKPFIKEEMETWVRDQMYPVPSHITSSPGGVFGPLSSAAIAVIDMSARDMARRRMQNQGAASPVIELSAPATFANITGNDAVQITARFRAVLTTLDCFERERASFRFFEIQGKSHSQNNIHSFNFK